MRSVPADPLRRRPHGGALFASLLALALVAVGLAGCSGSTSIPPPVASADGSGARIAAASDTIDALSTALRDDDAVAAAGLASGKVREQLAAAADNVARLKIDDLELRFVDQLGVPGQDPAYGPQAWSATVELTYRYAGWDSVPTTVDTTMVFAPGGDGQLVAGIGGTDGRVPTWLQGPITPVRSARTLVLLRTGSAERYSALAQRAIRDVNKVLPDWRGTLVLEVPASETELDQALGVAQERYANIAAVTASLDGSQNPGSAVHVFLNPRVFGALGSRGAQVVISHETTHVATGGTFSPMPTWLLEGFADYVALDHAGIPVSVAASQILRRIKTQGLPDHLPTATELSPTAPGLGATYEEAWLAVRSIARAYGERKLVEFYRAMDAGDSLEQGFRRLGTTEAGFVRVWRADLRALRDGVAG